jgi:hypothetical protein
MNDATIILLCIVLAVGFSLIGFFYGYLTGVNHAHRKNTTALYRENGRHHRSTTRGGEVLGGWESCSVLPSEAEGKLVSDVYRRAD